MNPTDLLPHRPPVRLCCAALLLTCATTALATAQATTQTGRPDVRAEPPAPLPRPVRVALRARDGGADRLTSLRYVGGFESKTLLYETLVRRGPDGRLAPGLASRWSVDADGRTFHFELREGARFHDGTPVTPEAVRIHFRRWFGLPEHDWLLANRHITDVQVESERGFRVCLDQPYALLADLCVINPCAIVGPGARDWEGEFKRPMGSGPFRFVAALDGGKRWRLAPVEGEGPELEVSYFPRGRDTLPIDALRRGEIDAFVGGWDEDLPAESLAGLARDPRFRVQDAPGTSVVYLGFRLEGATNDLALRQRVAAAIDRTALVRIAEGGRAEECTAWAAPAVAFWPRGTASARPQPAAAARDATPGPRLRIAAGRRESRAGRVAEAVAGQLRAAGFEVELVAGGGGRGAQSQPGRRRGVGDSGEVTSSPPPVGTVTPLTPESGEVRAAANREMRERADQADLQVYITHGAPYDPHQSLVARFGPARTRERSRPGVDPELYALVTALSMTPDEDQCLPLYAQIQKLLDEKALIVPLYAPWRVALHTAEVEGIQLGPDVYSVDLTGLRRVAEVR